ncbi:MAG: hypothetical protein HC860_20810 [Alkalinema sp. RU_4_3]|nr:hypothetical protein [Alkalinema sp. RU_4_3]
MVGKPKGFGKSLHQKQMDESLQKSLEKLSKKLVREDLTGTFAKTVISPAGAVKMSEVLEDFVDPYLKFTRGPQERKNIFDIAMLAWNLALLPEPERQVMRERMIEEAIAQTGVLRQDFSQLVDGMIARKLACFADNRRLIVSVELKNTGRDEFQLLVASTLESNP